MKLKNVALSLMLTGSMFAVGCDDDDGGTDTSTTQSGTTVIASCDAPGDEAAVKFALTTLKLPSESSGIGFNIDGSTKDNVCGIPDARNGVDNSLAGLLSSVADLTADLGIDIPGALQEVVTTGALDLDIELVGWNGTANDSCVGVRISGQSGGEDIAVISGRAPLANGAIAGVKFDNALTFDASFEIEGEPATLAIAIQNLSARIQLNSERTAIVEGTNNNNASFVAGHVVYQGALRDSLVTLIAGLGAGLDATTLDNVVSDYLDLKPQGTGYDLNCREGQGTSLSIGLQIAASAAE